MLTRIAPYAAIAALFVSAVIGCGDSSETAPADAELETTESEAPQDALKLDISELDSTIWVRRYLPLKASSGYNLVLFQARTPMLIDMNGKIVHVWPAVDAAGRVRLNRDGRLVVLGRDRLVKEYDWDGTLTWSYRLPGERDFPHHDIIRLSNGNHLILGRDGMTQADYLFEVDAQGGVSWVWKIADHAQEFPTWNPKKINPSHLNSVHELSSNRWFDSGDERFRPGNILVSARNLDTVFIIDRSNGEVVWKYTGDFDFQHEATLIPSGEPRAGRVLVFNNRFHFRDGRRRSLVQAINPITTRVEWEYSSEFFFSQIMGTAQALPGGNVLICSSQGRRTFEISSDGEIVWEWTPPFFPKRSERLAYDHCPQLAALTRPREDEVHPVDDRPFIDADLYKFGLTNDTQPRRVGNRKRRVMRWSTGCRELLIPPDAILRVEFGLDMTQLNGREISARFQMTLNTEDSPRSIIDERIGLGSPKLWQKRVISLGDLAYRRVELCIDTQAEGDIENPLDLALWFAPRVTSSTQRPPLRQEPEDLSPEEELLREQQLKVLGYVD